MSGTIARKTGSLHVQTYMVCGPFVQLISREISQATSSLTFSTRDSILEIIEDRVSRREDRGSRDCQLTFERYCICAVGKHIKGTLSYLLYHILLNMACCLLQLRFVVLQQEKNAKRGESNEMFTEKKKLLLTGSKFHQNGSCDFWLGSV